MSLSMKICVVYRPTVYSVYIVGLYIYIDLYIPYGFTPLLDYCSIKQDAVLLQGGPRDAAVNFDT